MSEQTQTPDPVVPPQPVLLDEAPPAPAAAPPAPEAKAPEPADGEYVYEPTGDVGLDLALNFVAKAGIGQDHPAMQAAQAGDFSILKATLAAKNAVGWEQFVALGEAAYQRQAETAKAKAEEGRKLIYAAVGGEDEWNAIKAWAGKNADPAEKAEINALLSQGGLAAKSAAKYLAEAYSRANNVTVDPRDPTATASRGGIPGPASGPLDPKAYAAAVSELNVRLKGRLEGSKEYDALQRRRAAFRG